MPGGVYDFPIPLLVRFRTRRKKQDGFHELVWGLLAMGAGNNEMRNEIHNEIHNEIRIL